MGLTANPFHPVTKELLPGFRDAYLRGDLSRAKTQLVDDYLKANSRQGDEAFARFHSLRTAGHQVRPVGWVQQQFQLLRTEPARFRRRATSLLLAGVLVSGMVFAGTRAEHKVGPTGGNPATLRQLGKITTLAAGLLPTTGAATATAATTTVLRGQVLNENGQPLIGATVVNKENGRGVSTNAQGNYALEVPATGTAQLQYGFGGYYETEVATQGKNVQTVTLLPDAAKLRRLHKQHWWQF